MLFGAIRGSHNGGFLLGLLAVFLIVLFFSGEVSALPQQQDDFPDIMQEANKPTNWARNHGFFYGREQLTSNDNCDGQVICHGLRGEHYQRIDRLGLTDIVREPVPGDFSNNVGEKLNSSDQRDSVGAAYIIFSMLGKSGSEANGNPVAAAKVLFPEWKARVDQYFAEKLVARFDFSGDFKFNNTYYQQNHGDVSWYVWDDGLKRSTVFLFLDPDNRTDYKKARYAIRLECGNPLGQGLIPPIQPQVMVKTEISIGGGAWSTAAMSNVNPNTTVRWRHTITNPAAMAVSGEYNIWDNKQGATYDGNNTDTRGGTFMHGGGGNSTKKSFANAGQGVISVVETGSFTVPTGMPVGTTYCENEYLKISNRPGIPSTQLCVRVSRSPVAVSSCLLPNSSYSINYGGTQARSGVTNMTKGGEWKYTDGETSTPAVVWAKPGDNVQFEHMLCFGAQRVRGSKQPVPDTGRRGTMIRDVIPTAKNSFTIRAFTDPATPGGNYLFGNALSGNGSQSVTLSQLDVSKLTPKQVESRQLEKPPEIAGADRVENYWFIYRSPSPKAGKTYGCVGFDQEGSSRFGGQMDGGYQIPDFKIIPNSSCNSAKKVPTASDAGKTIEQDLEYLDVTAYINMKTLDFGGRCGCLYCNGTDAWVDKEGVDYNGAVDASADGTIGEQIHDCYSTGQCCGACCFTCEGCVGTSYGLTSYLYHPMTETASQGPIQKAQVKIPFNYTTKTTVKTNDSGGGAKPEVYGGSDMPVDIDIDIVPRVNEPVNGNTPYTTITKTGTYEIVAYTVDADVDYSRLNRGGVAVGGTEGKEACSYYGQNIGYGHKCQTVYRQGSVQLNEKGSITSAHEDIFSDSLTVPDELPVGTKFCVAIGIWPSDSHNVPTGVANGAGRNDTALQDGTGDYWNYSVPNCRTIAKKPTVQFWSAGVFATGKITTSQTKKLPWYNFTKRASAYTGTGDSIVSSYNSDQNNGGSRNVYGSFTEYETIAKSTVDGFASGAGFGYSLNNGGGPYVGSAGLPGGYLNVGYKGDPNVCTYSTQTIGNVGCNSGEKTTGDSEINSFGPTILNRLIKRYTGDGDAPIQSGVLNLSVAYQTASGVKYIRANGGATLGGYCAPSNAGANNTLVIDVSGKLTIAGDIIYDCGGKTFSSIAELPQVLIFADTIEIAGDVSRVDAWLIAGRKSGGEGTINTCSDRTGLQLGKDYQELKKERPSDPSYVHCDSQLTINGPVFAKKLLLNRNAGAGNNDDSIRPAEVFNLRADTYLWAYDQATRNSQAVTTYQRELAPRY